MSGAGPDRPLPSAHPLSGCRVLDLGIITAGAATAACLADFGAEVIKIESPTYRDPFRRWLSDKPADANDDLPPFFRATNRNKLGLNLDLKHPLGRAAFLRLVARSDVVVENFRRGVLRKLGLDYAALKAANPDIILASISSQGETGPDAMYVSYGSTLEAVAGLAWTTGYAGEAPTITGVDLNFPDQVVGLFATAMVVTAWHARQQGGGGVHLDMSQRELTSFLSGEAFVASSEGVAPGREGNMQAPHWLQECFLASDAAWMAVTIEVTQVQAVLRLLASDASVADVRACAEHMRNWAAQRPAAECVRLLRACGVAVAVVQSGTEVLSQRGVLWDQALQRSPQGSLVKGFPMQFDHTPMAVTREAPVVGADSDDVLRRVGGLVPGEIAALRAQGVI
jgi:crotonobetainyl-CoA:carnitine CoA-transferase CaiB-like acyl-CoA transferase